MRIDPAPKCVDPAQSGSGPHGVRIYRTPQSLLAVLLTLSSIFTLVLDLPALAAASANNKKKNADPALKGLPITELNADEAIQHALNRLAYGPRPGDVELSAKWDWQNGLISN